MSSSVKVEDVIDKIRNEYINGNYTIVDLSRKYNVPQSSLYGRKNRENWELLKNNRQPGTSIDEDGKLIVLTSLKVESIDFYFNVLRKCRELVDVCCVAKDIKTIVEARILAEDRLMVYATADKDNKEGEGNGILAALASYKKETEEPR